MNIFVFMYVWVPHGYLVVVFFFKKKGGFLMTGAIGRGFNC